MDFKSFFLSLSKQERAHFAARCGTTVGQLRNVAYARKCGERLAINIERESGMVGMCEVLRPDVDWGYLRGTQRVVPSRQAA